MKVLICGAGRVGQGIARRLSREKYQVTILDEDASLVERVSTELDVVGVVGHAAHPDVLEQAKLDECEMIVAVTHSDEINMMVCKIASLLFNTPNKVARIRSPAYLDKSFSRLISRDGMAIDVVISPELEIGNSILQRFETPGAILSASFGQGKLRLLGLDLGPTSPLLDTAIDQLPSLFPSLDARVVGVGRGERLFAPGRSDRLQVGDRAYLVVRTEHAKRLIDVFADETEATRNVVIIGGGNIGRHIASRLEKQPNIRLRIIEPDPERAEQASEVLRRAIVIQGDGLDPNILTEAGAEVAHFSIAVTNDDKVNLLVSTLAKNLGTRRTIALVNSPILAALSRDMKVDVMLDPRALTVSQVLLRLRKGRFVSLQSLEDGEAEVVEGVVYEASRLRDMQLTLGSLPDGIVVGAVYRDGEVIFPDDAFRLKPGDHVITFAEQDKTDTVERFFRVNPDYF